MSPHFMCVLVCYVENYSKDSAFLKHDGPHGMAPEKETASGLLLIYYARSEDLYPLHLRLKITKYCSKVNCMSTRTLSIDLVPSPPYT